MKISKIIYLFLVATTFFVSCGDSEESSAKELYNQAKSEYDSGRFNNARLLIDSLSTEYPKAYKTRREAEVLRREAMIKEKERDYLYLDSVYVSMEAKLKELLSGYKYNKNDRYMDVGYYTAQSQDLSKNSANTFLRASVNENGIAFITSFYRGARIDYNTVKVSSGESFVQCGNPYTSRSYHSGGVYNERCDYRYGDDGGMMDFIAVADGPFKVELSGGKGKYSYVLRQSDAVAIQSIMELSNHLKEFKQICELREDARVSLSILLRNREISESAKNDAEITSAEE